MSESSELSGVEKTFVALAAATGGGCRTCAERLFAVSQSLDMDPADIDRAFQEGFEVRDVATRLMREKVRSFQPGEATAEPTPTPAAGERIRKLARLAAAVAANAGPAALDYAEAARAAGASEAALGVAIGMGRSIRGKAQGFSDEELGELGNAKADPCGCEEAPRRSSAACCGG